MFTGLIRHLGTLSSSVQRNQLIELTIKNRALIDQGLAVGDSVAVNGACLTVTRLLQDSFMVQAVQETQSRSTISQWTSGQILNLERPLTLQSFLDGHLVTGHVDGLATVVKIEEKGESKQIYFQFPKLLNRYIAEKGSVTLDGISLTVFLKSDAQFGVAIIPHTFNHTAARMWTIGGSVHLEVDIIARYLEALTRNESQSSLDLNFLTKHGF